MLQAAFELIGQKRSSTQHIVNLLMLGPPPHEYSVSLNVRSSIFKKRFLISFFSFNSFAGGSLSTSRAQRADTPLHLQVQALCLHISNAFGSASFSSLSSDQYVLFCSRQFLFHGIGSLQSTPREAGEEQPLQQQQQQHATPLKQNPPSEAFVDLTRPLKNGKQLKAGETRRQSSQQQTSKSFENTQATVEVASSQLMFEKRDAETSTSAVLNYAALLERCVCDISLKSHLFSFTFVLLCDVAFYA